MGFFGVMLGAGNERQVLEALEQMLLQFCAVNGYRLVHSERNVEVHNGRKRIGEIDGFYIIETSRGYEALVVEVKSSERGVRTFNERKKLDAADLYARQKGYRGAGLNIILALYLGKGREEFGKLYKIEYRSGRIAEEFAAYRESLFQDNQ